MHLIKRMRVVSVDNERYLMLNGLTGTIDLIDEAVYQLYLRWKNQKQILETDNQEMFNNFKERGYLVEPGEEEVKVKRLFDLLEERVNETKKRIDPIFLLTYNCNFRCSYCYEKNVMSMGRDQLLRKMTPKNVNDLFDYFCAHDILVEEIALYGGEPLLHSNEDTIRTILQRVQEKDLRIKVTTNGYTLDYYAPLLSSVDVKNIQVTLDGNEERHDRSRYLANGKGTFKKILKNLQIAKKYNLPLLIRCNIEVNEDGQVEKVLDVLDDYGLKDALDIQLFIAPVFQPENQYQCSHDFLSNYLKHIDKFFNNPILMDQVLTRIHRIANNFLDQKKWSPTFTYCAAHVTQQIFDACGNIYPCQALVGQKENAIGHYDQSGEITYNTNNDLWQNRNLKNMKKCRDCDLALFCGGGCALQSLLEHGDVMEGNCASMEELIKVFLPYLYKKYLK